MLRSSFYEGFLSIVSLEVFAEPCDLGQGLREAINNSEHGGAVFRANFENCATSLTARGGEEGAGAASNKDSEVSVWWACARVFAGMHLEQGLLKTVSTLK